MNHSTEWNISKAGEWALQVWFKQPRETCHDAVSGNWLRPGDRLNVADSQHQALALDLKLTASARGDSGFQRHLGEEEEQVQAAQSSCEQQISLRDHRNYTDKECILYPVVPGRNLQDQQFEGKQKVAVGSCEAKEVFVSWPPAGLLSSESLFLRYPIGLYTSL